MCTDFNLYKFKNQYEKLYGSAPCDRFLHWFIGFTEGDGCFTSNRNHKNLCFVVSQSLEDQQILTHIAEKLQFGSVIKQGKRVSRYVVQDRKHIGLLINLFNGNLVLPSRKKQFLAFLEWYNANPRVEERIEGLRTQIYPSLNHGWLAGFSDAEGCFTASCLADKKAFRLRYLVTQKGQENLPILSILIQLFRGGNLEAHSVKGCFTYVLSGVKKCYHLYEYFDKHKLLTKKRCSYELWKKLHKDISQKKHLSEQGRLECIEMAKLINSVKRKNR